MQKTIHQLKVSFDLLYFSEVTSLRLVLCRPWARSKLLSCTDCLSCGWLPCPSLAYSAAEAPGSCGWGKLFPSLGWNGAESSKIHLGGGGSFNLEVKGKSWVNLLSNNLLLVSSQKTVGNLFLFQLLRAITDSKVAAGNTAMTSWRWKTNPVSCNSFNELAFPMLIQLKWFTDRWIYGACFIF